MKADGTIWIDTKIDENGMEKGFNRIRDGADDVAVSVRKAGQSIEQSFSKINFNKTVENLKSQIKSMEAELESVSREFADATKLDDDKSAERLASKREKIYDRIERARERLAAEVAAAAQKEAAAEEKASKRVIAAEEKEAAAKKKAIADQFAGMGKAADNFGSRLRGIAASAFIFNLLSSGLRKVTSYFGSALMANNQFAAATYRLRGSLMVAFQPIYESVLPALITLINWLNVAVQAVARFFTILAGKSYKQMQSNASSLNNAIGNLGDSSGNAGGSIGDMGDSMEEAADQAKKASRALAGFDEITKLISEDAQDASESIGNSGLDIDIGEFNAPIFDEVELPEEWNTAIEKLAMRFKDIFFEWENLNEEIVAEKLLTALMTLAGGIIGFKLGGVKGALIGMTIGASLGTILSSLIFDGDGALSKNEIFQSLISALMAIGGTALVFARGAAKGYVIGVTAVAALSLLLADAIFVNDGRVTENELGKSLLSILLGISGGVVGFFAGGPGGALVGASAGLGLALKLIKMEIKPDSSAISAKKFEELLLDIILPLGLGAAGFALTGGNVAGALVGAVVGLGLSFILKKFDAVKTEGNVTYEEILNGILDVLMSIGGSAIGFYALAGTAVGGPGGAVIGAAIGLLLSFFLPDVTFEGLKAVYDKLVGVVEESSAMVQETTDEQLIKPLEKKFDGLTQKVTGIFSQTQESIKYSFKNAALGVQQEFVQPTEQAIQETSKTIQKSMNDAKDGIIESMEDAARGTKNGYIEPVEKESAELAQNLIRDSNKTTDLIVNNWQDAERRTDAVYLTPLKNNFSETSNEIYKEMSTAKKNVQEDWKDLPGWFQTFITSPMGDFFNNLTSTMVEGFNKTARSVANAIEDLMDSFNSILRYVNGTVASFGSRASATSKVSTQATSTNYSVAAMSMYPQTPEIPMLARGAVIPPNQKFLAVLGDQRSGTNIEAPLTTIQEAVAVVMEDMIQSNLAGHEATVALLQQILEAVLGIELDGETITRAVNNYNRKMAAAKGGLA